MLCQRVASKLVGNSTFPKLKIEDDPDAEQFVKIIVDATNLRAELIEPIRRCLSAGSVFVRFYFINGIIQVEHYLSKYCYPVFDSAGNLESISIKYVYDDQEDLDSKGKPLKKWYRLDLNQTSDIEYDNPLFVANAEPVFQEVNRIDHDLGFVQGQWFRTNKNKHDPDGYSLIEDILDFIDELNYSLSQSSVAISYNQDPQLALAGLDVDEIENLIRSSSKAWNLGREGKAEFLETDLKGVQVAEESRAKIRLNVQDISRVVLLDPEKIVGNAQSGKAMEILHGPFVELIEELRPMFERDIIALIDKIIITYLGLINSGVETGLIIPKGWKPSSLNITALWPPIFPMTVADLMEKVKVGVAVAGANLISRETITRWIAKDFNVEDVEEELAKINAQPIINPFAAF
jgi:hypothetical protein